MLRDHLAEALVEAGRFEDALAQYLWLWDESLHHSEGYFGVRLSFLLGDLKGLSIRYPPANEAMEQRRQALEASLRDGHLPDQAVTSVVLDLDALHEQFFAVPERTLELYDELRAKLGDEDLRIVTLRERLTERLVWKRRYAEAVNHRGSLVERYKASLETEKRLRETMQLPEGLADLIDPEEETQRCVDRGLPYFEAYAGVGRGAEALAIARLAIELAPREATFVKLLQRAERAEAPATGRELLELAKTSLDGEALSNAERAGAWIH
jgi:tetratricopeptide (TPR) repeat protein